MSNRIDYFCSETVRQDLKGKTVRGGVATVIGQFARIVVSLASIPVLSRLLTPEDFGLVAMVTVVTGFAAMFIDAGLSMATVQQDEVNHRQLSNLFWLASLLGTILALLVSALSPVIAWVLNEPRLIGITLAIASSFVLSGLTIQHNALMRRAMQFKALVIIQTISLIVSQGLAILWAWYYHSYWALVVMPIASALIQFLGAWLACSWRPSWISRGSGVRSMVAFGANLTGFNFTNYFSRNADNMLISWYWGAASLGYYERAYRLLMLPLQLINTPLSSVAIPALSRLSQAPDRYRDAYLRLLELVLILTVPMTAFLLVTHDWCIELVLGPQWKGSIPIFGWLVISSFTQPISNSTGWLFISQGRGKEMFQWGILSGVITVISFLIGLPWGPTAVAASFVLAGLFLRLPILIFLITRKGPVRLNDYGRCLWLPTLLGIANVVCLQVVRSQFYFNGEVGSILVFLGVTMACSLLAMVATNSGRTILTKGYKQMLSYRTAGNPNVEDDLTTKS